MKKHKIYQLWWQGYELAPDIVKICRNSLLRNYDPETQEIIFLDKTNIFHYVDLPGYIMDKFQKGIVSTTHLSDVIRSMLLKETGGMWADATMFFAKPLSEDIFCRDFFTMKNPDTFPGDITSKWECFFIGGRPDFPLFHMLSDFWLEYWKRECELITYLLTDHIFYIAYHENQRVKKAIDLCPSFYYRIDYFQKMMNQIYQETKYQEVIKNEPYIKMSYKFPLKETVQDGRDTYYGLLMKEYL